MIKINLLGTAPPPVTTTTTTTAPAGRTFQIGVLVGAAVVCFAIVGVIWKIWSAQVDKLNHDLAQEKRRQAELADVKAQNDRYQRRLHDLEQRINTIQMLQASRTGPVEEMTVLGMIVNRMPDIYLYSLDPRGDRLAIRGQTNTVDTMANFLNYMGHSESFTDVQLRQFYQDNQESRLNYKFSLDFMYRMPTPQAAGTQPGAAPAGRPGPARPAGM